MWDASSLRGYSVAVSGEHFGKIADFLFAGPDWAIASLVIEAGSWLQSRRVVVPVADFGHPIVETRTITLQLTADQVAQLPDHAPDLSVVDMHSLDTIAKASVEGIAAMQAGDLDVAPLQSYFKGTF